LSHNISILEKCKSEQEREFYIRSCRKHGWNGSVLVHQIENQAFQRTVSSQTNFGAALDPAVSVHAQLAVKDEYTFAFLDLEDAHSERELERALTGRVEAFLQEMGNMFTFVGSQYKIQVGEREFFIDLLLYHSRLQALVALELKIGEFEPEYRQDAVLPFGPRRYCSSARRAAFDRHHSLQDERPTGRRVRLEGRCPTDRSILIQRDTPCAKEVAGSVAQRRSDRVVVGRDRLNLR
jgi:predicted nuclease of restriction endonuclease-like (RecB) superfamily